jgi:YesN/AraC family two-component response regulator
MQVPEVGSVYHARNGQEAINLSKLHQPVLFILNIRMPEIDGLTVAMVLNIQFPAVRILFVGSLTDSFFERQCC